MSKVANRLLENFCPSTHSSIRKILRNNENIVFHSILKKKGKVVTRKVRLILTDFGRIICSKPSGPLKKIIELNCNSVLIKSAARAFILKTNGKEYKFVDYSWNMEQWLVIIRKSIEYMRILVQDEESDIVKNYFPDLASFYDHLLSGNNCNDSFNLSISTSGKNSLHLTKSNERRRSTMSPTALYKNASNITIRGKSISSNGKKEESPKDTLCSTETTDIELEDDHSLQRNFKSFRTRDNMGGFNPRAAQRHAQHMSNY